MRVLGVLLALTACSYTVPAGTSTGDDGPAGDGPQPPDGPPIDAPPNAWLTGWSHRKSITIHANQVAAPGGLSQFPVLIQFPVDAEIAAIARADGADLAVTGDDATTPLRFDLEAYAQGATTLWVKVPMLDDAADTRLYLYYGNATPPPHDPEEVWSNQFVGVWHLSQNPNNGTAGDIKDATGNQHDGQAAGPMTNANVAVGQAGPAIEFANNDAVDVPSTVNLGEKFTISAWVFLSGGIGIKTVFSNSISGLNIPGCRLFVNSDDTSDRMALFETSNGDPAMHRTATTSINRVPAGAWTHIAVVANRMAGTAKIFINGVDRTAGGTIRTDFANTTSAHLGRMGDTFTWAGTLDQIEIASELRTPEWIGTAVSNQSVPDDFFDLGPEELDPN